MKGLIETNCDDKERAEKMDIREVNNLVAEKVMGYVRSNYRGQEGWGTPDQYTWYSHFNPAGDISDTWKVVYKLRKVNDFWFELSTPESFSLKYKCTFQLDDMEESEIADTAQMAICLAALKAVGEVD
jgi:hypothetical protein